MITVAILPPKEDGESSEAKARLEKRYQRLAEAISSDDTAVRVVAEDARADVFLVAPTARRVNPLGTPPMRTVILGYPHSAVFEATDQAGVAGAVDVLSIEYWGSQLDGDMTPWLVARSGLLRGPGWNQSLVLVPDIVIGSHPDDPDLPSLLRRYAHEIARAATEPGPTQGVGRPRP